MVRKFVVKNLLAKPLTPLILVGLGQAVWADNTVVMPAGENTEPSSTAVASGTGFSISIEGDSAAAPADAAPNRARRADVALSKADVRVTFDGLNIRPRLDLVILNEKPAKAGETLKVQSQMNYPAFVTRGEMRVIDLGNTGRPRTVMVVPVDPNGVARITVPEGQDLAVVHRVYDQKGRFDETVPRPLYRAPDGIVMDQLEGDAVEEGTSSLARQRIPIFGGAITVSGDNVPPGARVETLGENIQPDPSGSFVVQRILPPGDQPVAVQVRGAGPATYIERNITIPRNEWFYTATADLTYGWRVGNPTTATGAPLDDTYSYGRIAGYAKGRTANGWTITASVDTNEAEWDEMFRSFDEKDPYSVLLRAARENAYPTFGDDSTMEEGAPTDGKFYLKAEKDGNHLLWGNYKAGVTGSKYLRNERQLYGLHGVYRSAEQTSRGQARAGIELYAASPDRLPGREIFRGTGGSIYFLQRQDISLGSETITVEIRDRDTGRVIETRTLSEGRDYDVNSIQGVITLAAPLSGTAGTGGVVSSPDSGSDIYLIVNYEYTPTAGDVDGYAYGGRAEAWVTDQLRLGVTGMVEQTDIADQTAVGADLRYEIGENSHIGLEYAETRGPGFGSSLSNTGGLVITSNGTAGAAGTTGRAYSAEVELDFGDLGAARPGHFGAYYERRTAGFSTLDYQTTSSEELWGVALESELSDRATVSVSYDDYSNATGKLVREGEVALKYAVSDQSTWELGVAHLDKVTPGGAADETGRRTDAALRYTRAVNDDLTWYVYGQATLDRAGGLSRNDRIGAGAKLQLAPNWRFDGEISDGSQGAAGAAMLTYQSNGYDKAYIGYRLEPGREFSGVTLNGRDRGTWVAGGQRRVGDNVDIFGEVTHDLFGRHRAMTSAYGVRYPVTEQLTVSGAFEFGQVRDGVDNLDRKALSLGVRYDDGQALKASAKMEYRLDDGQIGGLVRDQQALFLSAGARYKIDEESRLLFSLEYTDTQTDSSSILSGTYADVTLGYAYRPVLDDRLNLLFKYRYLYDMIGQEVDGSATRGPRQESHVVSVDLAYDVNRNWTLGAKVGGRFGRSAPDDTTALQTNDAWLGVLNARYHVVHNWDLLLEMRHLEAKQAGISETSYVAAAYRHLGNNLKLGVGYNFGQFSDDLTDLTYDDKGFFLNLVAKF